MIRLISLLLVTVAVVLSSSAVEAADLAAMEEASMRAAVERVAPSVLRIQTVGGLSAAGGVALGSGPSSGVAVTDDGYIISSRFNFAREPATILVELPDGTSRPARLVASDNNRSLVLLKIDLPAGAKPLPVPQAVPAEEVSVGAWAIAVGRALSPKQPNMSVGIISATGRVWSKAVQTDAKISPSNYGGPLIDIRGRVFGILAPLSPQATGPTAGAEWYDSGIGFAVPLTHVFSVLDRLKSGENLEPGVMGITLKGRDQFGESPIVAVARYGSPAAEAGIVAGDVIVEANGRLVGNQAKLKHVVSPLYAGDTLRLAIMRDKVRKEFEFELTDKLPPYAHPFLGILPLRDGADEDGLPVRYVFPDSGADKAGVEAGDRITKVGKKQIEKLADVLQALLPLEPGQDVDVAMERAGEKKDLKIALGLLPTKVPAELPPAAASEDVSNDPKPAVAVGTVEIKLPEFGNNCFAYVPENYDPAKQYGVVVWLERPGGLDRNALVARWTKRCEQNDLILLAPQPSRRDRWLPDEVEFIQRTLDRIRDDYEIDPMRVVAHGFQAGGAMAFLLFDSADAAIHGVAVVNAAMPAAATPEALKPTERAAVFWAFDNDGDDADRIGAAAKRFRDLNYPVTERDVPSASRYLDDAGLDELVRWIDSLDRI